MENRTLIAIRDALKLYFEPLIKWIAKPREKPTLLKTLVKFFVLLAAMAVLSHAPKRFAPVIGAAGGVTLYFWILFPALQAPFGVLRKRYIKDEHRPG